MRGSPSRDERAKSVERIIPAHAGLTTLGQWSAGQSRDHPRACGAHVAVCQSTHERRGSSPRMRGSRQLRAGGLVCDGIIPAHAGLTVVQMESNT